MNLLQIINSMMKLKLKRLEQQQKSLQSEWVTREEKRQFLNEALIRATEADTKFKLEKQIEDEEKKLRSLGEELNSIEQEIESIRQKLADEKTNPPPQERPKQLLSVPLVLSISLVFSLIGFSLWRGRTISVVENLISNSETNYSSKGLEDSIRAGRKLVQSPFLWIWGDPALTTEVALHLRLAIENTYETNRLSADAEITNIDVSPDGNLIAAGNSNGEIQIWEIDGTPLQGDILGHHVNSVDFNSDGNMLIASNDYGVVKVWNIIDGKGLEPKAISLEYRSVRGSQVQFSGANIVIADFCNGGINCTGNIKLFDLNGKLLSSVTAHIEGIKSISLSPDEKRLISISVSNTTKFWRIEDNQIISDEELSNSTNIGALNEPISNADIAKVDFSQSSGNFIALGDIYGKIHIWGDTNERKFSCTSEKSNAGIEEIKFSQDGKTLITLISGSNLIHIWQIQQNECSLIEEISGHTDIIRDIDLSPEGQIISGGNDKTIRIWDVNAILEDDRPNSRTASDDVSSVDVSSDSSRLVIAYENGEIHPLNISENGDLEDLRADPCIGLDRLISGIQFGPGNDSIIISTDSPGGDGSTPSDNNAEQYLYIKEIETSWHSEICNRDSLKGLPNHPGHGDGIQAISVSPDRHILASASWDNTIRLWDLNKSELLTTISKACNPQSVDIDPNNQIIALGNTDGEIKLWRVNASTGNSLEDEDDCSTDEAFLTLEGHSGLVSSVSFSPDGKTLLTLDSEGILRLWKTSTDNLLLKRDIGEVFSIAYFNSDKNNPILFVSTSDTFSLWSLNLERLLQEGCERIRDYLENNNKADLCSF